MLLHVIKHPVIFLNKQLKTDHKCCKILPNVEPRLHGTNHQLTNRVDPRSKAPLISETPYAQLRYSCDNIGLQMSPKSCKIKKVNFQRNNENGLKTAHKSLSTYIIVGTLHIITCEK